MKQEFVLTAVVRTELGKGASRRLRRANERVAAIIYGGAEQPKPIAIDKPALYKFIEEESFFSSIITIDVNGQKEQVIIRDLQRHPYKSLLMHADFLRINANEEITMTVPLHFINEDSCVGVKEQGGMLNYLATDVEVRCLPKDIPAYLELDIANLKLGEILHLSDLVVPEGVVLEELDDNEDHNLALVTVTHATGGEEDETPAAPTAPVAPDNKSE